MSRGETSRFYRYHYSEFTAFNKKINDLREVIPSETCPFCPVFFVSESPISFDVKELNVVWFDLPDNGLILKPFLDLFAYFISYYPCFRQALFRATLKTRRIIKPPMEPFAFAWKHRAGA